MNLAGLPAEEQLLRLLAPRPDGRMSFTAAKGTLGWTNDQLVQVVRGLGAAVADLGNHLQITDAGRTILAETDRRNNDG